MVLPAVVWRTPPPALASIAAMALAIAGDMVDIANLHDDQRLAHGCASGRLEETATGTGLHRGNGLGHGRTTRSTTLISTVTDSLLMVAPAVVWRKLPPALASIAAMALAIAG
jgi:hypothetical protein